MIKNLKSNITDLAYAAVYMAEDTLKTASGQEKKTAAIEYIVSMLPIPSILKGLGCNASWLFTKLKVLDLKRLYKEEI